MAPATRVGRGASGLILLRRGSRMVWA